MKQCILGLVVAMTAAREPAQKLSFYELPIEEEGKQIVVYMQNYKDYSYI